VRQFNWHFWLVQVPFLALFYLFSMWEMFSLTVNPRTGQPLNGSMTYRVVGCVFFNLIFTVGLWQWFREKR